MSTVSLVLDGVAYSVPEIPLCRTCDLFKSNVALMALPYTVRTSVPIPTFRAFLDAIEGERIAITQSNSSGLCDLCDEFGFSGLAARIARFRRSPADPAIPEAGPDCGARLAALEATVGAQQQAIQDLRDQLSAVQGELQRLTGSADRSTPPPTPPAVPEPACAPRAPPRIEFHSAVLDDFPEIFKPFQWKSIALLYRGGTDGFTARVFHERCNRRANTLTIIQATDGCVFGGFTPVPWEGPQTAKYKADDSGKSFLFTMKNPHEIPPSIFPLKRDHRKRAIECSENYGPTFGGGRDIRICSDCDTRAENICYFGFSYANSPEVTGDRYCFFTTTKNFFVKEIEVFQVTV
jgi:uncharacterized coiled-coil protein SlyX